MTYEEEEIKASIKEVKEKIDYGVIRQMAKKYPNDANFGSKIREYLNKLKKK